MAEHEWPHKYQFLERVPPERHDRAGRLFDSLLWTVGEAPCAGLRSARRAASPGEIDVAAARLGLESALRTLHSGGDLVAQLAAVCLFDAPPSPSKVHMNGEKFRLAIGQINPAIHNQFEQLRVDASWMYVSDSTNTMKHIEALQMVFGLGGGITVRSFKRGGREHPEMPLTAVDAHVTHVQALLWEVSWSVYEALK